MPRLVGRPRRPLPGGSTPSRPGRRAGTWSGFARSHREGMRPARASPRSSSSPARRPRRRSRGSRAERGRAGPRRRSRSGWHSCAGRRAAQLSEARGRARLPRRTAPPVGSSAATAPAAAADRGGRARPASGTWCERQVPSTGTPSTSFGPVQPFGVRSTITGQRGRSAPPSARAARWIARDLVERLVEDGGERLVHQHRVVALDEERPPAVALEQRAQLLLGDAGEHASGSRSCSRSGAGSAGPPRR